MWESIKISFKLLMYDIHSHLGKKIREAKLVVYEKKEMEMRKENDEIDREKNNFYSV